LFTSRNNGSVKQPVDVGGFLMSELEESVQEVLLAWTPSVVFLFIVLLRDWLYRHRRRISD